MLEVSRFITTESFYISIEQLLANAPGALKFHGIDPKELDEIGVTPQEFAYLLTNFTAGGMYHRSFDNNDETPFPLDNYRAVMLKSPDTRRAWPILKKLMGPSRYRNKIENTINLIGQLEERNPGTL